MIGKIAAVIGSTGMIGNRVLQLLLEDDYFSTVRVIVRRPTEKSHPKMEVKLVDFKDAESLKLALEGTDAVFSCVGTTNSKVKGDKQLYRSIDVDIPVRAARFAKEVGCEKFLLVSAVGANINSSNSYLKIKGEAEEGVRASGINTI
ncbi:MAG: NAD(P)H-binding protein, partial [Chitinophagaceae bacterium]